MKKKPAPVPDSELAIERICPSCKRAGNHAQWCPAKNRIPPTREADDAAD